MWLKYLPDSYIEAPLESGQYQGFYFDVAATPILRRGRRNKHRRRFEVIATFCTYCVTWLYSLTGVVIDDKFPLKFLVLTCDSQPKYIYY